MKISDTHWLKTVPIAHRGLWGNGIVENSLTAYQNAVDNGYAIEIDLHLSSDKVLFSFHDSTLKRMTGEEGLLSDKTYDELKSLTLVGSNEKIPTFDEILDLVDGKVPLLIEIKNQPDKSVVDRIVKRLETYKGEYALQSFNPLYMLRVKKLNPNIIRGVLSSKHKFKTSAFNNFAIHSMMFNFLIKPDFLSYDHVYLPIPKRRVGKKTVLAWTITDQSALDKAKKSADNFIFEHFIPRI